MQYASLEHINPSQLEDYFRSLCLITKKYSKEQKSMQDLDKHLDKIKKFSKGKKFDASNIPELKAKINNVLESERKILGYKKQHTATEKELQEKVSQLEHELEKTKHERDTAVEENKKRIHELTVSLLSIKTSMNEFIEAKKKKEKRFRELEEKIKKKSK